MPAPFFNFHCSTRKVDEQIGHVRRMDVRGFIGFFTFVSLLLCSILLVALSPIKAFGQSVTVFWQDNSSDEVGFRCERQTNGGSFFQTCDVGANVTSFSDTNVVIGATYCMRVRAYNSAGNSAYSNAPCVTLTVDVPNAVLNLSCLTVPEGAGGLVLAMSFNAGTGTVAADISGNSNTGTITGAAWTTGQYGGALSFDGIDDWVTVADSASLDLITGMTLSAWVFPSTTTNWRTVVMKEQATELAYSLYTSNGNEQPTSITFGSVKYYLSGSSALPLNAWTHITATYDGIQHRLYLNGVQVASSAVTGAIVVSTGVLRIGGNGIYGEYLAGKIDEVRIYNRALSVGEIQADMTTPIL